MRKPQEDVMARTEAERELGNILIEEGLTNPGDDPAEVGRRVLDVLAKAVEFEMGTSRDPDKQVVPMRRLVITGAWTVDPNGAAKQ